MCGIATLFEPGAPAWLGAAVRDMTSAVRHRGPNGEGFAFFAPADGAVTAVISDATPVGIAECDQFLDAYASCIAEKVPEAQRPSLQGHLNQMRAAWRRAVTTPQGRDGIIPACRSARENVRLATSAYGCIF